MRVASMKMQGAAGFREPGGCRRSDKTKAQVPTAEDRVAESIVSASIPLLLGAVRLKRVIKAKLSSSPLQAYVLPTAGRNVSTNLFKLLSSPLSPSTTRSTTATMLRKKEVYTNITPIPSHIPRQLAIDILHSHSEIITLNPLVLEHNPIKAPRDAAADEYYATWYEITERIQYIPGMGKMGSGKISFKGCFHDMPWGLQTHIYAPMNIDLRNNWRIAGNQPGEPPETRELGLGAPAEGLYLREDIEIKCNLTMTSFVKSQMRAASKILVERLIKKAELLDAGVLHAMMEDGKLKTVNPADRSSHLHANYPHSLPPNSPRLGYQFPMPSPTFGYRPGTAETQQSQYVPQPYGQHNPGIAMELPGDFYHPGNNESTYLQPQPPLSPRSNRDSTTSTTWSDRQSMTSTRPTSYQSDSSYRSPALEQKGFTSDLPPMQESYKELEAGTTTENTHNTQLDSSGGLKQDLRYKYNPQDFAGLSPQRANRRSR